jgi:hypothetical protein
LLVEHADLYAASRTVIELNNRLVTAARAHSQAVAGKNGVEKMKADLAVERQRLDTALLSSIWRVSTQASP